MLQNCSGLPKLLYFLRTGTSSHHPALSEKLDKTARDRLSKVCNKNAADISDTQLALPAEMSGLGVSSASLLAFPFFLVQGFQSQLQLIESLPIISDSVPISIP